MPKTPRVVQAAPGPMPINKPAQPVSSNSSVTSYVTQLPMITGIFILVQNLLRSSAL
jgi:hypothetical protein